MDGSISLKAGLLEKKACRPEKTQSDCPVPCLRWATGAQTPRITATAASCPCAIGPCRASAGWRHVAGAVGQGRLGSMDVNIGTVRRA